jgi:signal transduction histidine kinase
MGNGKLLIQNKLINKSITIVAIFAIPLNIIIFIALRNSQYQFPRYIPLLFGLAAILLSIFSNKLLFNINVWAFISLVFFTGCFNLLLGLLDMASLWFILAIIYTLLIEKKREALFVFLISFLVISVTGILMMMKTSFIPLQYGFENCQFACVAVRIMHFLMIGYLVYFILKEFISSNRIFITELKLKTENLENLNIALKTENSEKNKLRQEMLEAVIMTEEKERKRIATDLHDGLGPVLSAINLYYQAYIDAPDGKSKIEIETRLKDIIQNSISDVSRISHNISPHILENYGLTASLENFIDQINISQNIKFDADFESIGRFDLKKELTIYRTIIELINNTIKHAGASLVTLRIFIEDDLLIVYYSDNGKGFNTHEKLHSKKGMGLNNIQYRIQSLNGNISFDNLNNPGTKIKIEIPYSEIDAKE